MINPRTLNYATGNPSKFTRLIYGLFGLLTLIVDVGLIYAIYSSAAWLLGLINAPAIVILLLAFAGVLFFGGIIVLLAIIGGAAVVIGIGG